jgi:CRP/FNR family transcriptional regulator, cyclic AMP receptor protein
VTGLVVRLSGKCRHFTSAEVKTTPVEAASDAFGWRTGMSTEVTDVLRTTDLLGSASAADLEAIAAASRPRTFRRGQVLFTAGDPGNTLIVVISGRVKVVVRSADGGELTLTVIAPGGVIGELSVVDGGPRSADAETLEDCRLLFVPREVIQDLCGRAPSVAQDLASSVAASLRRLTEEASDLVFLDLPRRVAKVLLSQPRGDDGVIGQKMTQEELAHRVGGARQSVNAALRGFERRGWIQVRNQAVTVQQPAALSRFAGD